MENKLNKEVKSLEVDIAGISLKLRTNHSTEEVNELVDYVDQKCRALMNLSRNTNVQTAALLTALSVTEELFRLKNDLKSHVNQIEERADTILSQLEASGFNLTALDN